MSHTPSIWNTPRLETRHPKLPDKQRKNMKKFARECNANPTGFFKLMLTSRVRARKKMIRLRNKDGKIHYRIKYEENATILNDFQRSADSKRDLPINR